jgi:hypothetical protein
MTSSVVNSYVSNTTETLSSVGDDLLVTSAGSIVNTNSDYGVVSSASNQAITVDGLVYSVDAGYGIGVEITGQSSSLFVNGQIQGDEGVWVYDTNNVNVNIGAQGSIDGVNGNGIVFEGNVSSPSVTNYTLGNAGDITAGFGFPETAVAFEYGGNDLVSNSGTISSTFAISFYGNVETETVENSGTIEGGTGGSSSAINSVYSSAGIAITNSGLITDGAQNATGNAYALIYFYDDTGTTSTIDNEGTITGAGYVIQSVSDNLDISNSGTIHGGLYATSTVDVENSGVWQEATGDTSGVFSLSGSDDTITNTGTITGDIDLTGSRDTLTNGGRIHGTVTMGARGTLTNTGTIHGNVVLGPDDVFDSSKGEITGTMKAGNSDTFDFSGSFGHNTILDFVATGTHHDTMNFLSDDFGSYAAVESHMAQVGSDVVITLDATDTIVLVSQTLSNVTASDFTFG